MSLIQELWFTYSIKQILLYLICLFIFDLPYSMNSAIMVYLINQLGNSNCETDIGRIAYCKVNMSRLAKERTISDCVKNVVNKLDAIFSMYME